MGMLTQNKKLKKSGIWGFGITPGMTCVKCSVPCYAVRGMYNVHSKTCVAKWEANLEHTMSDSFITKMYLELSRKRKCTHIRIHTEGDFYNQEYLNRWKRIARIFPDKKFYAYTKALHLDFRNMPKNLKIIQSVGGDYDYLIDYNKPHARIFNDSEELRAAGYE